MSEQEKSPSFESAVKELEDIIAALEEGELPLEEALKRFERAVTLSRLSQEKLKSAEQKVQMLINQNGQDVLTDLPENES
ncbi:MAG: exodeoxyribonuclease VII small subunit XseB [Idiomarinaceae bacterium HL-53]|nr:MAG: exodeoxyribonuclease VII small subunit XseB [Idiomarinaceae bacterium HL-53]CUS48334.1 Exodeoxyribonuclease VII small subunit [Idiomarinaceae bacterium HL-53]